MSADTFRWIECPRDAMQGWSHPIPAGEKIAYLDSLMKVGFDVLDAGSFVSPKAIPQMADTAEVLAGLDWASTVSRLLVIVANLRGAEQAVSVPAVRYLGFPFSVSETFQQRNTGKSIAESLAEVEKIQERCVATGKELLIYISMGFGNPYGDPYSPGIAVEWVEKLASLGIREFAMSDTVGVAREEDIRSVFSTLIPRFPGCTIGAHFHATVESWRGKMDAAWDAGCRSFDTAMRGIGGCPMAKDELTGNMATESVLQWAKEKHIPLRIEEAAFAEALRQAGTLFTR